MSLLVVAGVAGGVAALAMIGGGFWWAVRRRTRAVGSLPNVEQAKRVLPDYAAGPLLQPYGVALGDVVLLRNSEAWITGALRVLDAGDDEAGLFFTDQTEEGDVLLIRPHPRRSMFIVRAVDVGEAAVALHTLEYDGELFTRKRKIQATTVCYGRGCPAVGDSASWAWFESSATDVIVGVRSESAARAWRGRPVDEGSTFRLAAGKATFRE